MPNKFDQLREGLAIEVEPGLSARLNKENKTLELSSGRVLDVADDSNYFPKNEKDLSLSRRRSHVEKKAKGTGGEFFHQYSTQGIPGGVLDWPAYLTQTAEEYIEGKQAEQETSQRISRESPYISAAATGANIATDLALTRGMSAVKAAPLLTLGSAGSRLATDTQNVIGETASAALMGGVADKVGGYLGDVASRRGAIRSQPYVTLPPANTLAEKSGDLLEKSFLKGRSPLNNIGRLAGLKYVAGKAALPLEAAYLGAKGLTSPTAGGAMARLTFKQAGIQAIENWAQKYPSYTNGVLANPQDRRSLTKEIEDDEEIPLEQKAILQSKVNRGKSIHSTL